MWFQIKNTDIEIRVYVKPNAKTSALLAIHDHELHIALHAKPHQGEANAELLRFISKLFKVPKTHISLVRGDASRHKVLLLPLNKTIEQFIHKNSIS